MGVEAGHSTFRLMFCCPRPASPTADGVRRGREGMLWVLMVGGLDTRPDGVVRSARRGARMANDDSYQLRPKQRQPCSLDCTCASCRETSRLFKITHDDPMGGLEERAISLRELVAVPQMPQPFYSIGEDWNDD